MSPFVSPPTNLFTFTAGNWKGTASFQYHVTDPLGAPSNSATVSVDVPDPPPQVSRPADQRNWEGDSVSLPLQASDPDGDPLSYSASGLPPGLSINASTGVISGVPSSTSGDTGQHVYTVTVSVADGQSGSSG